MDFKGGLSKFAKSISNGASSAAKISAEVFETTKLSISIESIEDKITETKEEIGNKIYKKYKNGDVIDSDLVKLCKSIDEFNKNIESKKRKIAEIKNIRICSKCNAEIYEDAEYCPKCGKQL